MIKEKRKAYLSVHQSKNGLWHWMALGDGFGIKQGGFPSKEAAVNAVNKQDWLPDVQPTWN